MHIILALLAIGGAVYFWLNRARNAADIATDVADMAETAMGAARRFGFRRRANKHPVESIEDPKLAIGGLTTAFLELSGLPTKEEKEALVIGLQSALDLSHDDAQELTVLGHWFVNTCNGAQPAITRLAKRLNKLAGDEGLTTSMKVIQRIAETGDGVLSPTQGESLDEIKRVFKIK